MDKKLLQQLPKMDVLLDHPLIVTALETLPYHAVKEAARAALDALRQGVLSGAVETLPPPEDLARSAVEAARLACRPHLRHVINGTGVVLHTNLGRAPLGDAAALAVYDAAKGYSNLEYNLDEGRRGSRFSHVEALICALTGAEAAIVVNNNASAVFLMLSALAYGKNVAISRGELVEIGGSFRVPDIMARSGANLIEVGTTNKTRLTDYEKAISERGAEVLLKVHTSNFQIVGFTEEAPLEDMVALGRTHDLPVLHDLGSGALFGGLGVPAGPTVEDSMKAGADVICFSGDKLLGGPQAGIAIGKKTMIDAMKRDPFARVVRIDKLTLAALECTLRFYKDPALAVQSIPTLSMLGARQDDLKDRAAAFSQRLSMRLGGACTLTISPDNGEVGGGSLPAVPLPTYVVELLPAAITVDALELGLRSWSLPIIGRINRGKYLLDVRTLTAEDMEEIERALCVVLKTEG